MRRLVIAIFAVLMLLTPGVTRPAHQPTRHRGRCRYLSHNLILTSLKDAKANRYAVQRVPSAAVNILARATRGRDMKPAILILAALSAICFGQDPALRMPK